MRALVKTHAGPGLELIDVPEPAMGINDVRIGVRKTGICGTDLHIDSWDTWAAKTIKPPLVVGHEFVGEVLEIGSNVTDLLPGDTVSGEGHVVCGHCRHCRAGGPIDSHRMAEPNGLARPARPARPARRLECQLRATKLRKALAPLRQSRQTLIGSVGPHPDGIG
jgi:threonine dehydrogenase-like Zn-dependent dehydrogenase